MVDKISVPEIWKVVDKALSNKADSSSLSTFLMYEEPVHILHSKDKIDTSKRPIGGLAEIVYLESWWVRQGFADPGLCLTEIQTANIINGRWECDSYEYHLLPPNYHLASVFEKEPNLAEAQLRAFIGSDYKYGQQRSLAEMSIELLEFTDNSRLGDKIKYDHELWEQFEKQPKTVPQVQEYFQSIRDNHGWESAEVHFVGQCNLIDSLLSKLPKLIPIDRFTRSYTLVLEEQSERQAAADQVIKDMEGSDDLADQLLLEYYQMIPAAVSRRMGNERAIEMRTLESVLTRMGKGDQIKVLWRTAEVNSVIMPPGG